MSKRTNPTVIGAFVVGAVILIAIAVALFGGSEFFAKRQNYVAYFTEDTKGLRVGSNVLLNGVRVGYVSEIALLMDEQTFNTRTRVTLVILTDTFLVTREGVLVGTGTRDYVDHDRLIYDAGLRAQLETQSFVTGQLLVTMVFRPDTRAIIRGGKNPPYPEIPTIPSEMQALMAKLKDWVIDFGENVDFEEITVRLNSVLVGLDELSNSETIRSTIAGVDRIVNSKDTQQLSASAQKTLAKLQDTLASLQESVDGIQLAATQANEFFQNADGQLEMLASDLRPAIVSLVDVLAKTEETLVEAREQLRGESIQMYQLETTLREVDAAARAIRAFFDYVERNPEALLKGKNQ